MNQTLKYYTLIETCKNVGLNVKEYFAYVSVNLYRARGITKDFLPVLSHGKFKLTKVKTEIIRGGELLSAYYSMVYIKI